MKGLKKSVLMGAALALLLGSAGAEAFQAKAAAAGSVTEEVTEAAGTEKAPTEAAAAESLTEAVTEPIRTEPSGTEEAAAEVMQTETAGTEASLTEAEEAGSAAEVTTEPAEAESAAAEAMQQDPAAAQETDTESAALNSENRAAAADPVDLNSYLTVTWTREKEGEPTLVYTQGKDDAAIAGISEGIWHLEIVVDFQANGKPLSDGSYSCALVWPAGDEVSLPGGAFGDILIHGISGFGTWELSGDGKLTLKPENIDSLTDVFGLISTSVMVGREEASGPDVQPGSLFIDKDGLFDAPAQKVFWTVEVTVPAWMGGTVSSWCVQDFEKATPSSWSESFKNEYSQMIVDGPKEGTAWMYEEGEDGSALIWFLNPCTCDVNPCEGGQSGGRPCEHTKYTDTSGQAWCTCWHRTESSNFVLSYTADTAQLQQQMQECGETQVRLINTVRLLQSGEWASEDLANVEVHQAIKKAENEAPDPDNDYSSSCTVTVNPSFDDYSGASYIEVTDRMENLTYIGDSLSVTCRYQDGTETALTQISDREAVALGREGNENRFFSMETSGEDSCFCVSLWYPTQASYTLTYQAAVAELVPGGETNYQNTASLGRVSSTVKGKGFRVDDAWFGRTFEATVLKIDARSPEEDPTGLAGAVFEVRQVNDEGEDLLADTLTTGEDGTDVFRTKRQEGILVEQNTLYYLQESVPPEGYERNGEKYYFYFSPEDDMVLPEGITAVKGEKQEDTAVPTYRLTLVVPDEPEELKELPAAGGPGEALFFVLGLALIAASRKTVLPG